MIPHAAHIRCMIPYLVYDTIFGLWYHIRSMIPHLLYIPYYSDTTPTDTVSALIPHLLWYRTCSITAFALLPHLIPNTICTIIPYLLHYRVWFPIPYTPRYHTRSIAVSALLPLSISDTASILIPYPLYYRICSIVVFDFYHSIKLDTIVVFVTYLHFASVFTMLEYLAADRGATILALQ
jgi:hypothetical protein